MKISFSIIIIAPSESEANASLTSIRHFQRLDSFEVILVTGNNPSAQRNAGALAAKNQYLLFLDNDSVCPPDLLEKYQDAILKAGHVDIMGGPSVSPPPNGCFQQIVAQIFNNIFVIGPVKSRYQCMGRLRPSHEKELILCNLLVRRDFFVKSDGFDERIYPHEENDFLNKCDSTTYIWHCPDTFVYRSHRKNPRELIQQMIRYGKGRAKGVLKKPSPAQLIFAAPALLLIYLCALPFITDPYYFGPLALYVLLLVFNTLTFAILSMSIKNSVGFMVLTPSIHIAYGAGFLVGLWGKLKGPKNIIVKVKLMKLSSLEETPIS